jgi:pimeloyl-ACP methyl ester carboxylesterase
MPLHVERLGDAGPRLVLVHGSVSPGWATWSAQRPLSDRYRLVLPIRSGYPPNPLLPAIDFDVQADELAALLERGDHLVGHSYGAVVALMAVAQSPVRLASLTVIETPAYGIARGFPDADRLIDAMTQFFSVPRQPREFLVSFLQFVGSPSPVPEVLSPTLEQSVRATMVERAPWEARFPFDALRSLEIPVLVASGAHSAAYDAVCDVLVAELRAQRLVLPGAGHPVQRLGEPFNAALDSFVSAAQLPDVVSATGTSDEAATGTAS